MLLHDRHHERTVPPIGLTGRDTKRTAKHRQPLRTLEKVRRSKKIRGRVPGNQLLT